MLVYTTRHSEDRDDVDDITGMFFIYFAPYFTLIDICSTHFYVSSDVSVNLGIPIEYTTREVFVIYLLGQSVQVDKVYR